MSERSLDIVVFGATGFTGRLVCNYLAAHAPPSLRWAPAGRDRGKLEQIASSIAGPKCPPQPVLVADIRSDESLRALASRTRVLLTTVGPYALYGRAVLQAAVAEGAHYLDITGEPDFVAQSIRDHHAEARSKGLKVIHCCGFDSIPYDLGALYTAQLLPPGVPMRIEGYLRARASLSGGTWQSAIQAFATARGAIRLPKDDTPGRSVGSTRTRPKYVQEIESWVLPLPTIDPLIVQRSARALDVFGPEFRYGHYLRVPNLATGVLGVGLVGSIVALARVPPLRERLLERRKPGEGPSEETRKRSWFEATFVGEAGSKRVVTTVSGGDPGYDETSKMISECALALILDGDRLPTNYGVVTTAVGLGDRLRERLQAAGIRFQIKSRM